VPLTRLLLLLILALAGVSCGNDPRPRAERQVRKIGPERLRQDAAILYKNAFAAHTLEMITIRTYNWPDSFRPLKPLRVGVYLDGVAVALAVQSTGETGIYVIPRSMDVEPRNAGGTKFEKITDGIYWYSFGG